MSFRSPLHLVANAVFLLRPRSNQDSSKPWLVTVEEFDRGKLRFRFPFTKTVIQDFPENFPKTLNLWDFHALVVARGYNIRILESYGVEESTTLTVRKVVLFSIPGQFAPLTVDDCTVMVLFSQGSLAWSRLRRGENQWGYGARQNASRFDDIVAFKECVYAVDRLGRVFAIHYDSLWLNGVSHQPTLRTKCVVNDSIFSGCYTDRRKRLVVDSSGVLYLIFRGVYCGEKIHFKVYKLDEERCKWDEVSSLGEDRILFVGVDWCFFTSTADFLGCRGNCILFLKNCFPMYANSLSGDDSFFEGASRELEVGVFHLKDGEAGLISGYPGFADILWPPPAWLLPKSDL